jgi:uncharacterized oxidoreductase
LLYKKSKVDLSGNTILITGGGSGIGLALAKEFLKRDNLVIICGRNADKLHEAKKSFPSLRIIQCDISNDGSVLAMLEEIKQNYPGFNFLVNNAAIMKLWNIQKEAVNIGEQKAEILTNLFGTVQLTQLLIPQLLKQPNSAILNVSSALADVPMPAAPVYSATKAAMHAYSIAIRRQLQNTTIRVFELLPAAIATEMASEMEKSIGIESNDPKMTPGKLALLTMKGLSNDTLEMRPGMANTLYMIHRIFPALAKKIIEGQSRKILHKL